MIRRLWLIMAFSALALLAPLAVACGDDDDATGDDGGDQTPSAEEIAALEETVTRIVETDPADEADLEYWFAHYTERLLQALGFATEEDCRAALEDCISEPSTVESFRDTEISGDSGSSVVSTADGEVTLAIFVKEGDEWLVDGFGSAAEIPAGVTEIEVTAVDYAYDWDPDEVTDGNVAFTMTNEGDELHEMAVARVTDEFDIDAVIEAAASASEDELPPGVEELIGFAFASPGASSNAVFEEPLEPGNYAFVCFIPDAEGAPHIELGMHSEFTVPE